jgi:FKBP-type peptidyl-prolyl cis-trans isomerase SlyD
MITKNKKVSVAYELRTQAEGELVETAGGETPFVYICGYEQSLPQFEQNLLGLKKGDSFEFDLDVEHAYGARNEEMLIELPLNLFGEVEEGMLAVGEVLPMQDSLGRSLQGTIKEIVGENLKMDFNHPLAGEHLYFKGSIQDIVDAKDEEITALTSGGCSGSCGSCNSGCGDDSQEEQSCGCGDDSKEDSCGCNC